MSTEGQLERAREIAEELEPYLELEGTETGEACSNLCRLISYDYCFDDEFYTALLVELESQLNMFKTRCTITERQETYTRTVREIEWDA